MFANSFNKIKVIYITNQACFHDIGFIDVFFDEYKGRIDFTYLTTEENWDTVRNSMHYDNISRKYIVCSKLLSTDQLQKLFENVDTICVGSNCDSRIKKFYKNCVNVVFCTEHLSKKKSLRSFLSFCKYTMSVYKYFGRKEKYLLSYSAFGIRDYKKMFFKKNNLYLFGYFPKLDIVSTETLYEKNKYSALWCGRLVDFKRISHALFAIKTLHNLDSRYSLTIIGDGPEKEKINKFIAKNNAKYIHLLTFQKHEDILKYMQKSMLYLFTSSKGEGWGVVLNEATSQGCFCVCSSKAGSTKAIHKDSKTCFMYSKKRDLKKRLIAYNNMTDAEIISKCKASLEYSKLWSYSVAGHRFGQFLIDINKKTIPSFLGYDDGPICRK